MNSCTFRKYVLALLSAWIDSVISITQVKLDVEISAFVDTVWIVVFHITTKLLIQLLFSVCLPLAAFVILKPHIVLKATIQYWTN